MMNRWRAFFIAYRQLNYDLQHDDYSQTIERLDKTARGIMEPTDRQWTESPQNVTARLGHG